MVAAAAFPLPRSVSKPLLDPRDSLSLFAADYAARTCVASVTVDPISWRTALKSVAEAVRSAPKIEKPGDKGDGIYVERTLMDAFLPLNATISVVRRPPTAFASEPSIHTKLQGFSKPFVLTSSSSASRGCAQALAFVTASANELTRSNKITDLVNYLVGEEEDDGSGEKPPPSLPWEWDRVGHDTCANLARDCGAQTLARCLERRAKASLGHGTSYCELLKHAHKAACKEFHECRKLPNSRGMAASGVFAATPSKRA